MKRNMGSADRLLRTVIVAPAAIVLSVTVFGAWSIAGMVALVFAGVMLATAATGFCPTYIPFGISTRGAFRTHGHVHFGGHSRAATQQ